MRTFRLDKLVRDEIVAGHEAEGGKCVSRVLTGKELEMALIDKVREEIDELLESENRELGEYADVRQAIQALAELDGYSDGELTAQMDKRVSEIGAFTAGVYIETVTVPESSWFADYYASRPERFPEVT